MSRNDLTSVSQVMNTVFIDDGVEVEGANTLFNMGLVAVSLNLDAGEHTESPVASMCREVRNDPRVAQAIVDSERDGVSLLHALRFQNVQPDYLARLTRLRQAYRDAEMSATVAKEEKDAKAATVRAVEEQHRKDEAASDLLRARRAKKTTVRDLAKSILVKQLPEYMPVTCAHCHIANTAPPVHAVRAAAPDSVDTSGGSMRGRAASSSRSWDALDKRRVSFVVPRQHGPDITYPVDLGLTDEEAVDTRLYAILSNATWPEADEYGNRLDKERKAAMLASHFQSRVGVPPWAEYFFRMKRLEMDTVARQNAHHQAVTKRLATLQSKAAAVKLEIAALEKALAIRDPAEHAAQVEVAISALRRDLETMEARHTEQLDHLRSLDKYAHRYTERITMEVEECRRCVALLMKLHDLARSTEQTPPDVLNKEAIAGLLLPILERFPTLALTQRHDLDDDDDGDVDVDPLGHQCPDCLLLKSSSPYCTVSGRRHKVSMPVADRPLDQSERDELLMSQSIREHAAKLGDGRRDKGGRDGESSNDDDGSKSDVSELSYSQVSSTTGDADSDCSSATGLRRKNRRRRRRRLAKAVTVDTQNDRTGPPKKRESERTVNAQQAAANAPILPDIKRVVAKVVTRQKMLKSVKSRYRDAKKLQARRAIDATGGGGGPQSTHEQLLVEIDAVLSQYTFPAPATSPVTLGGLDAPPATTQAVEDAAPFSEEDPGPPSEETEFPVYAVHPGDEGMLEHCRDYMEAATVKNLTAMRASAHRGLAESAATAAGASQVRLTLHEQETQFCEWFGLMLLRTQDTKIARLNMQLKSDIASTTVAQTEAILRTLRKELRNLTYSFQKRPKGRSAGANLDDEAFKALVNRIGDLEKRNLHLRTRLKYAVSERHIIENKHAALRGEFQSKNDLAAALRTEGSTSQSPAAIIISPEVRARSPAASMHVPDDMESACAKD
jgi:predicted  nucleic acid-binding Zn-ribbon protein